MFKKRKYKLVFHKRWLGGTDSEHYRLIADAEICSQTIQYAQEYNLEIKKIHLTNLYACVIVLKGTRNDYLYFVRKFVEANAKYIEKVTF